VVSTPPPGFVRNPGGLNTMPTTTGGPWLSAWPKTSSAATGPSKYDHILQTPGFLSTEASKYGQYTQREVNAIHPQAQTPSVRHPGGSRYKNDYPFDEAYPQQTRSDLGYDTVRSIDQAGVSREQLAHRGLPAHGPRPAGGCITLDISP
jgi:hypothetical protein